MLQSPHVQPFLRTREEEIRVAFLSDPEGRVAMLLERLCRLVRRLEGRSRAEVVEALRRQERRVRDVRRLAGISKTLLDLCDFQPPPGAERAGEAREALFRARGVCWPPLPGDERLPYERAAAALGTTAEEVERLLYADDLRARILVRAPAIDGRTLLERYNLELARAVLLDAARVTLEARGGWRGIFRAVKLARLMYRIERAGRGYRVELTGPAAPFLVRPQRYGVRFARVVPALTRAPRWSLEAAVLHRGRQLTFRMDARTLPAAPPHGRRRSYDSRWERALAADFAARLREERRGWSLHREATPLAVGGEIFLPDFTLRHADGREALVEILGFWTPEYLETKLRKIAAAGLENLILVVYRGLAVGAVEEVASGPVLSFANRPRIEEVLREAERVGRQPALVA
jgi:predicted nuclease of restriction endonuclease-like RecB superfamily